MADQDQVTNTMVTLMPIIREAFKKGAEEHKLSSVLQVEQQESALNVRLLQPKWPKPGDNLVRPQEHPETAWRLCRERPLQPVHADQATVKREAEQFGKDTAAVYVRAVLSKLVDAADKRVIATTKQPDVAQLHKWAEELGLPCRVVAGPALYSTFDEKLSDAYVESVVLEEKWPPHRALVLSLTSEGPWVEELEPMFVIEWARISDDSVRVEAARRLYVNKPGACILYGP